MGKHGILKIMVKTDGIVLERRKFDDQGNRVINHTRVQALLRVEVSFFTQRAWGHRVKLRIAEDAENRRRGR
jgi:hypothetical protein